jgi:hypothetical protein
VYDASTGAILRTGTALTEASARLQGSAPGTRVTLQGSDPKYDNVDVTPIGVEPGLTPKLPMRNQNGLTQASTTSIKADGVEMLTIHFVPSGAKVEVFLPANMNLIQPQDAIVTDGVINITTTVAGIYQVKVSYMNFLDFEASFNAY